MGAFDSYLGSLRNRREMEAHQFAQQKMERQVVGQQLANTVGMIADTLEKDKALRQQYMAQAEAVGIFNPKQWEAPTEFEQATLGMKNQLQNQYKTWNEKIANAERVKSSLRSELENLDNVDGMPIDERRAKIIQSKINKWEATIRNAQAEIDKANVESNGLDMKLAEYASSPVYQNDKYDSAFRRFYKENPISSRAYFATQMKYRQQMAEEELARKMSLEKYQSDLKKGEMDYKAKLDVYIDSAKENTKTEKDFKAYADGLINLVTDTLQSDEVKYDDLKKKDVRDKARRQLIALRQQANTPMLKAYIDGLMEIVAPEIKAETTAPVEKKPTWSEKRALKKAEEKAQDDALKAKIVEGLTK